MIHRQQFERENRPMGRMEETMLRPAADRRECGSREALLQRVRSEFAEMPCLRLTDAQARRLFDLRPDVCERVLATLVRERTLVCNADGRYRLTDAQLWPARSAFSRVVFRPRAS